jgi:hypothetical protein
MVVHHPHEARNSTLMRTIGPTFRISRGQEEHGGAFDKGPIVLCEVGMHQDLFESIREAPAVEPILKPAGTLIVYAICIHKAHPPCKGTHCGTSVTQFQWPDASCWFSNQ